MKRLFNELNEWFRSLLRWIPGSSGSRLRYYYYRNLLAGCGNGIGIATGCHIRNCRNIVLGNNVGLSINTQLYTGGNGNEKITIGNNVNLNSNVMINADCGGCIEIGNNCIIGPNVVFQSKQSYILNREIPVRSRAMNRVLLLSG